MNKLLAIYSSPVTDSSNSRQLVDHFIAQYQQETSDIKVVTRDVGMQPLPHLDQDLIGAFFTPPDQLAEDQKQAITLSNTLVEELETADIIVIGSPMHNFSITSHLKAYFDHIARVGRTFEYTENGPQGLLQNKIVFVITSRGGDYSQHPMSLMDHQEPYIRTFLGFLGIGDVTFVHAQGISSHSPEETLNRTRKNIEGHISSLAA